jgi:hypothetical protein
MIARRAAFLFALASAAAALARQAEPPAPPPSPVGPDAVWSPPPDFRAAMHNACDKGAPAHFGECFVTQMQKAGATGPALAFARRTGNQGYLRDFRNTGKVDVAHAEYPFRANQNQVCFLVNGDPAMIDVDDPQWINKAVLEANPVYADLLKRFPKLMIFPGTRFGETAPAGGNLKTGGQRFDLDYLLRDGCRACTAVGSMKVAFDFDVNGKFVEAQIGRVRARR